jgi:hypothetical protein
MNQTPFFPLWRPRLAALRCALTRAVEPLRRATLCQIEQTLGPALPPALLDKPSSGPHSRRRVFCLTRTFWGWIWQILQANTSCREVLRQFQAMLAISGLPPIRDNTSAFCQARNRLPKALLENIFAASSNKPQEITAPTTLLQGRPLKAADATSVRLQDTPANQQAYPGSGNQYGRPGFPALKVLAIFSLRSAVLLARATGSINISEQRLLMNLSDHIQPGDVIVGDRAYGLFVLLDWVYQRGADMVARLNCRSRNVDFRSRIKKLGFGDAVFLWDKPKVPSKLLSPEQWALLPEQMQVRVVRRRIHQKGFRTREITVATTLLDPQLYPAEELMELYFRRWRLEMCLDDLKTTLGMEQLSCRRPQLVEKQLLMFFIAHNLLRWIMAQAARQGAMPIERISFKGSLDALRQWASLRPQLRGPGKHAKWRKLWRELLQILANDAVPERPGRKEPRAVKKRSKYPRLTRSRHTYVDPWSRNKKRRVQRAKLRASAN